MSANIAQSVRDRLLNRARARGEDFGFLLNRFAAERILYLGNRAGRGENATGAISQLARSVDP